MKPTLLRRAVRERADAIAFVVSYLLAHRVQVRHIERSHNLNTEWEPVVREIPLFDHAAKGQQRGRRP